MKIKIGKTTQPPLVPDAMETHKDRLKIINPKAILFHFDSLLLRYIYDKPINPNKSAKLPKGIGLIKLWALGSFKITIL
ncbi:MULTISPECIES: hypothetical protein [Calditerrivibrio]|uniref:hypothetical protein n=1 Tax=Calditerrivibrio TaxID=545865 RepID=UPI003C79102E